jgi:carboxymethylenebutenolidase
MNSPKFNSYYLILIAASLVLSLSLVLSIGTIKSSNMAISFAYAQTNADMLDDTGSTFFFASDIGSHSNDSNNSSITASISGSSELQIKKDVRYFDNSSGYLVYPSSAATTIAAQSNTNLTKKIPAVIMVHENKGLNDNIIQMADTLAKQTGYAVLAVDLFKGETTNDPNRAMQLVKSARANPQETIANLQAAVKYVSSLPFVDSSKIASIGWCFGGGQSLQLALNSEKHPLAATVLYYGTPLVTDKQELSKIKWPVLGIFGDNDRAIPLPNIQQFKSALDADGIINEVHIYKGLGHAFANPSGANYAPKETGDAWQKTLAFLHKYL